MIRSIRFRFPFMKNSSISSFQNRTSFLSNSLYFLILKVFCFFIIRILSILAFSMNVVKLHFLIIVATFLFLSNLKILTIKNCQKNKLNNLYYVCKLNNEICVFLFI